MDVLNVLKHDLIILSRKCLFYDISKNANDPIQVLKGGNHILFEPESIALNRDYFVLSGRKPSAIFVWEWRKGVRISNRASKLDAMLSYDTFANLFISRRSITKHIVFSFQSSM
jgi:hypothetical protein